MAPAKAKPSGRVRIRMYNVGFGDCFLVTFPYTKKNGGDRHVLIDFGSTALPKGYPKDWMMKVAEDIKEKCGGRLDAVVATHRHRDHISGFTTGSKKKPNTGDVIRDLKPKLVVQPWTEHPKAKTGALAPPDDKAAKQEMRGFVRGLDTGQAFAQALSRMPRRALKGAAPEVLEELDYISNDNLANRSAVENLMRMGKPKKAEYLFYGKKSKLAAILPGVKVHVLGPPTLEQTKTIKSYKKGSDQYWILQLGLAKMFEAAARRGRGGPALFPGAVTISKSSAIPPARWFMDRMHRMGVEEVRAIVHALDTTLNNTSVILLFEVKGKLLLFPGDAQLENWEYALDGAPEKDRNRKLLAKTNLYKVGHHGSLNATPKKLWELFKRKQKADGAGKARLKSLCSTMPGKHGSVKSETEVPRRTLVAALAESSEYYTTQLKGSASHTDRGLAKKELSHLIEI